MRLSIDVWSDVACPWCYVGLRNLQDALRVFEHAEDVSVCWRAFELDPSAPAVPPASPSYVERLARKYGLPTAQAEGMIARMVGVGVERGIVFDFQRIQRGNTFDAHRLVALARQLDEQAGRSFTLQNALKERLFDALFCRGVKIGDRDALLAEAEAVGVDVDRAAAWLQMGEGASHVRADQAAAAQMGITGVPFFKIGQYGVSGAQPPALLVQVLTRVWQEESAAGAAHGDTASSQAPSADADADVCRADEVC